MRLVMFSPSLGPSMHFEPRRGLTDADGRCVFLDLPCGEAVLYASHARWGYPKSWDEPPERIPIDAPGTKAVQLEMFEGRTITGHVRDADLGTPIAGARVGFGWTLERAVLSNEAGFYEFPGFTGGKGHEFHATAEGYGRQSHAVPDVGPIDFALVRGDVLHARLVTGSGEPVAGARVVAMAWKQMHQRPPFDSSKRLR